MQAQWQRATFKAQMTDVQTRARQQQRTEELSAASIRALSGIADLHFRGRRLHRGRHALPVFAPHLHPTLDADDFVSFRGAADGLALRLAHSDENLHRSLRPSDPIQRLLFELMEQFRCEALVPESMPGVRRNLRHRFEAWSLAYRDAGATQSARGLLLYTVTQMCRARVTGEAVVEATQDLLEATRAGLAPVLGAALAGLRRWRADQAAYAQHALDIAQRVAAMLEGAAALTGSETPQDEVNRTDPWAAFSVLLDPGRSERSSASANCRSALLIDCSGSMQEHSESVAVLAELLVRALEQIGVATEVLGFTTNAWNGGRARRDWVRAGRPSHPGRLNEVCHIVFKDVDTSSRRARPGIAALLKGDLLREGIDGEAVDWAMQRFNTPARDVDDKPGDFEGPQRRLLFVVSDGSPMDSATHRENDAHYLEHHLRDVVERHGRTGAQIYGVGVGLDLSPYYRCFGLPALYVWPNRSADLAPAFCISTSRSRGCAVVTSDPINTRAAHATSATARSKASVFAFDGRLNPLSLRTNCSDASRISSSVAGGSKLKRVLMFLHMSAPWRLRAASRIAWPF